MRRADRLLQIIQILRRARGPIAASRIAEEVEVSLRTLYRDMASLESTGVPVRGEAGVGYVLEDGYDMPPLMFTVSELEAVMLGARMIDGRFDEELSRAAKDVVSKIAAVVPESLRSKLVDAPLFAPQFVRHSEQAVDMSIVREALRQEKQVDIDYVDLSGKESKRRIFPVMISVFRNSVVVAAWCTLREDFRSFRLDGMRTFEVLEVKLPKPRKTLFAEWKRSEAARYQSEDFGAGADGEIRGV